MFKSINSKACRDFIEEISCIDAKSITDKEIFDIFHSSKCKKYRKEDATIQDLYQFIGRRLTQKRFSIIKEEETHKEMRFKYRFGMNRPKVEEFLGINTKIYKKLVEKEILVPYKYDYFRKYGKEFEVPLYSYDDVVSIDPRVIESIGVKEGASKDIISKIQSLSEKLKHYNIYHHSQKWYTSVPFYEGLNVSVRVPLSDQPYFSKTFKGEPETALIASLEKAKQHQNVNQAKKLLSDVLYTPHIEVNNKILKYIEERLLKEEKSNLTLSFIKRVAQEAVSKYGFKLTKEEKDYFTEKANQSFSMANIIESYRSHMSNKRHFYIIEGPTNSGKTHQALEALSSAKSGAYLAPLRLLALEVRDLLSNKGVDCNLVTGEEIDTLKNATHVSSTIEMLDTRIEYDTVVIDESHMFFDLDRGGAWTRAILGANAKNIYLIGSPSATIALVDMIRHIGDTYEIITKERRSELTVLDSHIPYNHLTKGDAVIAFSRLDVMRYKTILEEKGKSVAVIYGGMPPEIRREESRRFREGKANILVATDAIGMGLNLPIRRVIFGALDKYDGRSYRPLTSQEFKQIAGRAGRNKEAGYVGIIKEQHMQKKNSKVLKKMLQTKEDVLPFSFALSIDKSLINKISNKFGSNSLSFVKYIFSKIKCDDTIYTFNHSGSGLSDDFLDANFSDLQMKHKLSLVSCPDSLHEDLNRLSVLKTTTFVKESHKFLDRSGYGARFIEDFYRFTLLYRSLHRLDSRKWKDDEEYIDDIMDEILHTLPEEIQCEYAYKFSKNLMP